MKVILTSVLILALPLPVFELSSLSLSLLPLLLSFTPVISESVPDFELTDERLVTTKLVNDGVVAVKVIDPVLVYRTPFRNIYCQRKIT